jgi:hypothetical protein
MMVSVVVVLLFLFLGDQGVGGQDHGGHAGSILQG